MARLLIKFFIFISLSMAIIYWISSRADGNTDNFYLKFTSPPQQSLIIGTSRAAQGLLPGVINRILGRNDLYNYAFTWENSPYGETYYDNIQRKLKKESKNGIFIVAVDPWCITCKNSEQNSASKFQESNLVLSTPFVSLNPNIPYLVKFTEKKYKLLLKRDSDLSLHDNGWLEIDVPMDTMSIRIRTERKIKMYEGYAQIVSFSKVRFSYLSQTIAYLKTKGDVFVVRLPVSSQMKQVEEQFMPNFDQKMDSLCKEYKTPYFNYILDSEKYTYTDGNHIYKQSGKMLSEDIALKIKQYLSASQ